MSAQSPIHHNMVRTQSWGLLHQPSALTYVHHGSSTLVDTSSGLSSNSSRSITQSQRVSTTTLCLTYIKLRTSLHQMHSRAAIPTSPHCFHGRSMLAWSWSYSGQGKCCKYSLASPCLMLIQHAGLCCLTPPCSLYTHGLLQLRRPLLPLWVNAPDRACMSG